MKPDLDLVGRQIVSELDRVARPTAEGYLPRYRRTARPWFRVPGLIATGLVAAGLMVLALTMATTTGSTNPNVWGLRLSSMVEETGNWGASSASPEPSPSPSPSDQPAAPRAGGDPAPPKVTVPALAAVKAETPKPHEAVTDQGSRKQPSPSPGGETRPVRSSPSPSASPSPQRSASPSPEPSDSPPPSPEPSHSPDSAR